MISADDTDCGPARHDRRRPVPYGTTDRPRKGVAQAIMGLVAILVFGSLLAGVIWYTTVPAKERDSLARAVDGRAEKERAAAADAVRALGKIQAATQVGVNHAHYGELVADAKAAVNDALRVLPAGPLVDHIKAAMDAYQHAGMVWSARFERGHRSEVENISDDLEIQDTWKVADTNLTAARAQLDRR